MLAFKAPLSSLYVRLARNDLSPYVQSRGAHSCCTSPTPSSQSSPALPHQKPRSSTKHSVEILPLTQSGRDANMALPLCVGVFVVVRVVRCVIVVDIPRGVGMVVQSFLCAGMAAPDVPLISVVGTHLWGLGADKHLCGEGERGTRCPRRSCGLRIVYACLLLRVRYDFRSWIATAWCPGLGCSFSGAPTDKL